MEKIKSEADYNQVMAKIDSLMAKGSDKVSKDELYEIRLLAEKAQAYELTRYTTTRSALTHVLCTAAPIWASHVRVMITSRRHLD